MAAVRHELKDRAWRQSHPVEVLRIRTHRQAILMALGTRHISPTASTAKDTESKDIVLSARKVASENPDVSAVSRALGAPDTADRGNRKPNSTVYYIHIYNTF